MPHLPASSDPKPAFATPGVAPSAVSAALGGVQSAHQIAQEELATLGDAQMAVCPILGA